MGRYQIFRLLKSRSLLVKVPFERFFVEMEHQELKKERHHLKQLSKTDTVTTVEKLKKEGRGRCAPNTAAVDLNHKYNL